MHARKKLNHNLHPILSLGQN